MYKSVEVNSKKNYVYMYGQGNVTIVLLSGSGVTFPNLEYMPLVKALADTYQVIGIEKLGYGHSDLAEGNREADVVIQEYRGVLRELGMNTPVVLAAHSMGFLEALRWGQLYPSEVLGVIGIDAATPECYEDFDIEAATKGLVMMSKNEELRRTSVDALIGQLAEEYPISPEEKKTLENLAYRNLANQNWISEAENLKDTIALVEKGNPYLQVPMFFFISNGEGTTLEKEVWIHHALQYLKHIETAQYELYDYPHNLYKYAYKEMAQALKKFITEHIA